MTQIIPPDLFIDTCILFGDYMLNNTNFNKIIKYKASTNCKIYVSDVVIDELIEQYKRNILHEEKGIDTLLGSISKKIDLVNQYIYEGSKLELNGLSNIKISQLITGYKQYLTFKLKRHGFTLLPIVYSEESYKNIINKSIQKKKPFSIIEKDKDKGVKDAVIWETYKEMLRTNHNLVFLSDNKNDFGNHNYTDFHSDLRDEIGLNGIYFYSVSDLLSTYIMDLEKILNNKEIESLVNIDEIEKIIQNNIGDMDYEIDHGLNYKIDILDFGPTGYIEDIRLYDPRIKFIGDLYVKLSISIEFNFEFEASVQGDREDAESFSSSGMTIGTCTIDLELNKANGSITLIHESCKIDTTILDSREVCEYIEYDLKRDREKSAEKSRTYDMRMAYDNEL